MSLAIICQLQSCKAELANSVEHLFLSGYVHIGVNACIIQWHYGIIYTLSG